MFLFFVPRFLRVFFSTLPTLPRGSQPFYLKLGRFFLSWQFLVKNKIHCDITGKKIFWIFGEVSGFIRFYFMIGFIYEEIYDVLLRTQGPTSHAGSHPSCQEIGRSMLQKRPPLIKHAWKSSNCPHPQNSRKSTHQSTSISEFFPY